MLWLNFKILLKSAGDLQQRIPTSAVNITQPLLKKAHFVGFLLWKEAFVIDSMITGDWTG